MSDENGVASVVERARRGFEAVAGWRVEAVSSIVRQDGGWRIGFEVVELARVPDSTSLLGTYDVAVDSDGNVLEFERSRRYYRNRADGDGL